MTTDEKKAWLRSAYRLDDELKSHLEELRVLRLALSSAGGSAGNGPRAPRYDGSNAQTSGVIRMIALEKKIKEEVAALEQRWTDIHDAIEALENQNERLVLRYRYLERKSYDEIADRMSYSTIRVRQIYSTALWHIEPPEKQDGSPGEQDGSPEETEG